MKGSENSLFFSFLRPVQGPKIVTNRVEAKYFVVYASSER